MPSSFIVVMRVNLLGFLNSLDLTKYDLLEFFSDTKFEVIIMWKNFFGYSTSPHFWIEEYPKYRNHKVNSRGNKEKWPGHTYKFFSFVSFQTDKCDNNTRDWSQCHGPGYPSWSICSAFKLYVFCEHLILEQIWPLSYSWFNILECSTIFLTLFQ